MILYLALLSFLLLFGSNKLVLNENSLLYYGNKYEKFIFILIALFLCGGYMVGSDWRSYETLYNSANFNDRIYYLSEPLFYILISTINNVISDYFVFAIASKLIVFFILFKFLKKYSPNIFISYFFYIPWFGLYLFIDNPLRFMIALGFVTISYKYIIESKIWKFLLLIITGSLFHYTILFFIPFYFIRKIRIRRVILLLFYVIWTFSFSALDFYKILESTQEYIPFIFNEYGGYINKLETFEGGTISIGLILNLFLFIIIVWNKKKIENNLKNGQLFYTFTIIYFFLSKFALILTAGVRLSHIFAPFFIIVLTFIVLDYSRNSKKIIPIILVLYILLYSYKKIDNHYVYIPYSNYITSKLTGNTHSYHYRNQYNLKKYYERKGEQYY